MYSCCAFVTDNDGGLFGEIWGISPIDLHSVGRQPAIASNSAASWRGSFFCTKQTAQRL
jgi:hypothetical protein